MVRQEVPTKINERLEAMAGFFNCQNLQVTGKNGKEKGDRAAANIHIKAELMRESRPARKAKSYLSTWLGFDFYLHSEACMQSKEKILLARQVAANAHANPAKGIDYLRG